MGQNPTQTEFAGSEPELSRTARKCSTFSLPFLFLSRAEMIEEATSFSGRNLESLAFLGKGIRYRDEKQNKQKIFCRKSVKLLRPYLKKKSIISLLFISQMRIIDEKMSNKN